MEESKTKSETSKSETSPSKNKRKRIEKFVCITCGKSDVEFSKSQIKRFRKGKGGECKKCILDRCHWKGRAQAAQWAKPGGSLEGRPKKKKKMSKEEETGKDKKEKTKEDCSS